jgi:hypothetical protein
VHGTAQIHLALCRAATTTLMRCGAQVRTGVAMVHRARIELAAGAKVDSERDATEALRLLDDFPPFRAYGLAVLADALAEIGRADAALACVHQLRAALKGPICAAESVGAMWVAYAQALAATGAYDEYEAAVRDGADWLRGRSEAIRAPDLRQRFLVGLPEHRRIQQLEAKGALGPTAPGLEKS